MKVTKSTKKNEITQYILSKKLQARAEFLTPTFYNMWATNCEIVFVLEILLLIAGVCLFGTTISFLGTTTSLLVYITLSIILFFNVCVSWFRAVDCTKFHCSIGKTYLAATWTDNGFKQVTKPFFTDYLSIGKMISWIFLEYKWKTSEEYHKLELKNSNTYWINVYNPEHSKNPLLLQAIRYEYLLDNYNKIEADLDCRISKIKSTIIQLEDIVRKVNFADSDYLIKLIKKLKSDEQAVRNKLAEVITIKLNTTGEYKTDRDQLEAIVAFKDIISASELSADNDEYLKEVDNQIAGIARQFDNTLSSLQNLKSEVSALTKSVPELKDIYS